jgi:hypothetical protein
MLSNKYIKIRLLKSGALQELRLAHEEHAPASGGRMVAQLTSAES